ncbi:NDP-sugar synthase [Kitasatospora sp. MAP5-34]|uniref:NDP-sugar synthase n=1 Tax=Kitasatospora sp. MAP5-34 TaxID=3035102 RepID=UPI0024732234|nr:NDP-sugar synthase [Kitasatospora sp. MAP5-34]MDH6574774.1 NDP-sugar pyrophosphorylase family protein [Kitasatospora sp. MAP5-34]
MESLSAIALVGGQGVRARPLTLNSSDYLRSKAAMCLAGRSLIEWAVEILQSQGVDRFFVAANGSENRAQTKAILEHGEQLGVSVRYSRTRFDRSNTGSGEATLRCLEYWDLGGLALVFPSDSVFDFDLASMVRAHRASDSVVTVASVLRPAAEAAGKYGVVLRGPDGGVTGFLEKPDLKTLELNGGSQVETNAGMYLVDCDRLRMIAREPALAMLAGRSLDWGGDLLPYLVGHGHQVSSYPIAKFGDLGSPRDYLTTLREVLRDEYPMLSGRIDPPVGPLAGARIHESSLYLKDEITGRTLAEKVADGTVRLGPNVRIGRDVEVGPGVMLAESDIGDGVDLGEGSSLRGVACGDHSIVGPGARISNAFLGAMVDIRSTLERPVVLEEFCALGDEVRVRAGTHLSGVSVFPRLDIRSEACIPAGASLSGLKDLLHWLGEQPADGRAA